MRTLNERTELDDYELSEHYNVSNAVRGRFYDAKKVSTTIRLHKAIKQVMAKSNSRPLHLWCSSQRRLVWMLSFSAPS